MTRRQALIRDLCRTTALVSSADWLVSENVREVRERQEVKYLMPVDEGFVRHLHEAIALDKTRKMIERIQR